MLAGRLFQILGAASLLQQMHKMQSVIGNAIYVCQKSGVKFRLTAINSADTSTMIVASKSNHVTCNFALKSSTSLHSTAEITGAHLKYKLLIRLYVTVIFNPRNLVTHICQV